MMENPLDSADKSNPRANKSHTNKSSFRKDSPPPSISKDEYSFSYDNSRKKPHTQNSAQSSSFRNKNKFSNKDTSSTKNNRTNFRSKYAEEADFKNRKEKFTKPKKSPQFAAQKFDKKFPPSHDSSTPLTALLKPGEPAIPTDIDIQSLDPRLRNELHSLEKQNGYIVAGHLLAIEKILEENPRKALEHARAAKERAGRLGSVRQIAGIVAYMCEEWNEASRELKTARRISGSDDILPIIADCERGMQRPHKAIEFINNIDMNTISLDTLVEIKIVESGAYRDMHHYDQALEVFTISPLQSLFDSIPEQSPIHARLYYAYAEALLATNNCHDAKKWFMHSNNTDPQGSDALARIEELNKNED